MQAVLYTNGNQESDRLVSLMSNLGLAYREYQLDCHFTDEQFKAEFGKNADYPQAFMNCRHLSNMSAIMRYLKSIEMI